MMKTGLTQYLNRKNRTSFFNSQPVPKKQPSFMFHTWTQNESEVQSWCRTLLPGHVFNCEWLLNLWKGRILTLEKQGLKTRSLDTALPKWDLTMRKQCSAFAPKLHRIIRHEGSLGRADECCCLNKGLRFSVDVLLFHLSLLRSCLPRWQSCKSYLQSLNHY